MGEYNLAKRNVSAAAVRDSETFHAPGHDADSRAINVALALKGQPFLDSKSIRFILYTGVATVFAAASLYVSSLFSKLSSKEKIQPRSTIESHVRPDIRNKITEEVITQNNLYGALRERFNSDSVIKKDFVYKDENTAILSYIERAYKEVGFEPSEQFWSEWRNCFGGGELAIKTALSKFLSNLQQKVPLSQAPNR